MKNQELLYCRIKAVNLKPGFYDYDLCLKVLWHLIDIQNDAAWGESLKTPTHVPNVMFAPWEPHAVLCLGGFMHDCAYVLSTASTPCAYLHTQSCFVSLCLKTSLLSETQNWSCLFAATCVSHQCWLYFPLSASLRRRGRDLRVCCVWCYSLKGQSEICKLKSCPKTVLLHLQTCVWPDILYNLRGSVNLSVRAVQVAG